MTKFENKGIDLQCSSTSIAEAKKNFSNSCRICCTYGMRIKCQNCTIAASHDMVVAAIMDANAGIVHHTCCEQQCNTAPEYNIKLCENYNKNKCTKQCIAASPSDEANNTETTE